MQEKEKLQKNGRKIPLVVIGILLLLAIMLSLLLVNKKNSWQSMPPILPEAYFEGEYRIGDGEWKTVKKGAHIPATRDDVTLKGQFHLVAPDGEDLGLAGQGVPLAFYANHISITVQEPGMEPLVMDVESAYAGEGLCGELCFAYELMTDGPITLTFHNPHAFGNEKAIDQFLEELSVYAGSPFENQFMSQGDGQRNVGLVFVITAFVLLGTALFSSLLHATGNGKLWMIGLSVLFAGGYFTYSAKGVFFWSDSVIGNTTILGICLMLYMLCVCGLIVSNLEGKLRKTGLAAVLVLGIACGTLAGLCLVTDIRFYDTWLWWAMLQSAVNIVLLVCLVLAFSGGDKKKKAVDIGAMVLLFGYEADVAGIAFGWWNGALVSMCAFAALFAIALVLVWQIVPKNINAARRNKEMEAEQKIIRAQLQENRVAIMISQIQPHFIYNTLGTIQHLCKVDPARAEQLVQNFSLYLRGNFSELDSATPIRFAQELEHVRYYTQIELVRFPDMTVQYDIQAQEFLLPALTVQPLVENAIKHGLMGLEQGGTVTICAYETDSHYCVKVTDDGVGFDENEPQDGRKHIGIRNVRERLQVMCGGSLTVESQKGKGTTALIQIPKEGKNL